MRTVEHDRVVEVAAQRETRAHVLEIAHETERARAAHFTQERRRRKFHRCDLRAALEHRVIELDFEVDLEAVVRIEARPLVAVLDLDALQDAHETLAAFCSSMPADCSRNTNGPRCHP